MDSENVIRGTGYLYINLENNSHDVLSTNAGMAHGISGIRLGEGDTFVSNGILSVNTGFNPTMCHTSKMELGDTSVTAISLANLSAGLIRIGEEPQPGQGWILTVVIIDCEIPVGSMARAGITATEAITAALQDLNLGYNSMSATGSVVQDVMVVSAVGKEPKLNDTGKHSRLGELIGKTVIESVKGAATFNAVSLDSRSTISASLAKHGVDQGALTSMLGISNAKDYIRMVASKDSDPEALAVINAAFHISDEIEWGLVGEAEGKQVGMDLLRCGSLRPVDAGSLRESVIATAVSYFKGL